MAVLKLFLSYYVSPLDAPSRTLDHGRFWMAVLLAAAVAVLMIAPDRVGVRKVAEAPEAASGDAVALLPEVVGLAPSRSLGELFFVGCLFAPVAIVTLTRWGSIGPTRLILERDYSGVTTCLMFAWAASHLPFAVARVAIGARGASNPAITLKGAALVYFLFLAACVLRSVPGGSFSSALVTSIAGAGASAAGGFLSGMIGFGMHSFATPLILYWLYLRFGSSVQGLGSGLSHQQSFRRALEATTLNPRDADAHYQLGLIYEQRRNSTEAEARFRKAAEIEPEDADYLLALGRTLREKDRMQEALPLLERASRINKKAGNHEVLRELGAVQLALDNPSEALRNLETYVERREYDPEGLVFYGQALARTGRSAEAKSAFERAIEAVATAPSYRKGLVRKWRDRAREELKRL